MSLKPKPERVDSNLFVLQPCRVRQGFFAATKDAPITLNWKELVAKFAPHRSRNGLLCLRNLQIGGYVGLVNSPQGLSVFYYGNLDRSGKIAAAVVKDETWSERVAEVYLVEKAQWAAKVVEL